MLSSSLIYFDSGLQPDFHEPQDHLSLTRFARSCSTGFLEVTDFEGPQELLSESQRGRKVVVFFEGPALETFVRLRVFSFKSPGSVRGRNGPSQCASLAA